MNFRPALGGFGGSIVFQNGHEAEDADTNDDETSDWSEENGHVLGILSAAV